MSESIQVVTVGSPAPDVVTVETARNVVVSDKEVFVFVAGGQGLPGRDGTNSGSFELIQSSAVNPIIVNHNLGFRPNVSVKTLGGVEVIAEVIHISVNQVQVFFDVPSTGIVTCS
jgi:hypothetical protein